MQMLAWLAAACGLSAAGWLLAAVLRLGPAGRFLSGFAFAAAGYVTAVVLAYPDFCSSDSGWCAVLVIGMTVTAGGFVLPAGAIWILLERVAGHRTADGSAP